VRVEPRLAVNSADAAIAAAEAGVGIARALSYQVHDAVAAGRLRLVLQPFERRPVPVNVMYPSLRLASANVTAFVKAARAQLSILPMIAAAPAGEDRPKLRP
jgi:DNA-binding transcriptional LysR family regulator